MPGPEFSLKLFRIHESQVYSPEPFANISGTASRDRMGLFRRIDVRPEFRFSRSTVFLMIFVLLIVVLAINQADMTVRNEVGRSLWDMSSSLLLFLALVCVTVVAIWGMLYATGHSGIDRLANVQTRPECH